MGDQVRTNRYNLARRLYRQYALSRFPLLSSISADLMLPPRTPPISQHSHPANFADLQSIVIMQSVTASTQYSRKCKFIGMPTCGSTGFKRAGRHGTRTVWAYATFCSPLFFLPLRTIAAPTLSFTLRQSRAYVMCVLRGWLNLC